MKNNKIFYLFIIVSILLIIGLGAFLIFARTNPSVLSKLINPKAPSQSQANPTTMPTTKPIIPIVDYAVFGNVVKIDEDSITINNASSTFNPSVTEYTIVINSQTTFIKVILPTLNSPSTSQNIKSSDIPVASRVKISVSPSSSNDTLTALTIYLLP